MNAALKYDSEYIMTIDKDEIRNKFIEIIKSDNINELRKYIKRNDINIKNLNNGYFDILITAIENKASIQMIEFIISIGKYKTLNYIIGERGSFIHKTPLSSAIERNEFDVADYLIEYEADINFISYDIIHNIVNNKNSKYLLYRGIHIDNTLIIHLIEENKNYFLKQIFNYYIYNTDFILTLLSFQKSRIPVSDKQFQNKITKEKEKIKVNELFYKTAIKNNNFEAINILFNNDSRGTNVKLNDIYNIFSFEEKKSKVNFINKIRNGEIKIPVNEEFLIKLEKIKTVNEKKEKIMELIKNDNVGELQNYIKENKINMSIYNEKYDENNDILKYSIENNISIKMLDYIIQECRYENLNFNININNEQQPLLYYIISQNKYKIFDFLIKKGADVNFGSILTCLYNNNLINNKNLKYILNNNFSIPMDNIKQLVMDSQFDLLENIFKKYVYNNYFILKLLFIYKDRKPLIKPELKKIINEEKGKLKFNETLYKVALDKDHYEAISFLYNYDNRNKDIILYELFKLLDKDERKRRSGKIFLFIDKIKNGEISIEIDERFLNNFFNIENKRNLVIEKIKTNDIMELKDYITKNHILLTYYNNENFDILIYAIENDVSIEIIKFIILYYSSLNYTIYDTQSCCYKSPFSCAISTNKFSIATLILNAGADLNYKIHNSDIFSKCNNEHTLNSKNLKFILNNGYSITTELITSLIRNNKNAILKTILNHFIYDNNFILKLLSCFRNNIAISKNQLEDVISREKSKIIIKHEWYFEALYYNNNDALGMLINIIGDKSNLFFDKFEMYKLLDKAIYEHNYNFVDKLFTSKLFDSKNFNIEEYLSSTRIRYRLDIVEYFIENIMKNESFDFKNVSFENLLLNISEINNITFSFIKNFIKESFHHDTFNFGYISLEKILLTMNRIREINEIDKMSFFKLCEFIIEHSLIHKTFNFKFAKFENILSIMCQYHIESSDFSYIYDLIELAIEKSLKQKSFDFQNINYENILLTINKLHNKDKDNSKGYFKLKKLIIERSLNHKTFDFKTILFENILFILCQYQYDDTDFPDFSYLIKTMIDQALHHTTFNIENINIKKTLLILKQIDENIPFLEFFIKELFDCQQFSISYENIQSILLVLKIIKNDEFIKFIINYILNCEKFNDNERYDIKKLLLIASHFESITIFKYFVKKILDHVTLELNSINIENILIALSKIDNSEYVNYVVEKTFNHSKFNRKSFNTKFIHIEKILVSAIHHNNLYFIKYIMEKLLEIDNIKDINFEKLLLISSKINNLSTMKYFIEKLLNITSIELLPNISSIDLSIIKNADTPFLSLIINIFIKLQNFLGIKYIIESNELKNNINLNVMDRNQEYPIIIAFDIVKDNPENLKIFNYLIEKGADYNIKVDNNLSLFLLALKEKNYIILNYLFKQNAPITMAIVFYIMLFLKKILNINLHINELNEKMETPLISLYKAKNYNLEEKKDLMVLFLEKGSDINSCDKNGKSILTYIIEDNLVLLLKLLIDNNENNPMDENMKISMLKCSIKYNNIDAFEYLIDNFEINRFMNEIINDIVVSERFDLLKILISKNIIKNIKEENNEQILIKAIISGNENMIYYLIHNGFNINVIDNIIIEKLINNNKINILKLLIPQYVDINNEDKNGDTSLIYAIKYQNYEIIKYLMENGADINIVNKKIKIIYPLINDNNYHLLKYLIENNLDINKKDQYGRTLLNYAISSKNYSMMYYLIQCQADFCCVDNKVEILDLILYDNKIDLLNIIISNFNIDEMLKDVIDKNRTDLLKLIIETTSYNYINNKNSHRILIYAIKKRNINIIKYLINYWVDTKGVYYKLIEEIIYDGKLDILKFLMAHNIKIELKGQGSISQLIYSIDRNEKIENCLIECGANTYISNNKIEVLDLIINKNSFNLVKILFPNYLDINITDHNGNTPLIHAIKNGNEQITKYLIDNGANTKNIKINIDIEMFKNILKLNNTELLNVLYNNKFDMNQKDKYDETMLNYAIKRGNDQIVKYLIDNGADVNKEGRWDDTPLIVAIKNRKINIIKYLIDKGVNVNYIDYLNESPLTINEKYNNKEGYFAIYDQIKEILNSKFDPEDKNVLLIIAINTNNESMIKNLIENGSNIDIVNKKIKLINTIINNHNLTLLKYLINIGLDVNSMDKNGYSPLIYAIKAQNKSIIDYLLECDTNINGIKDISIDFNLIKKILKLNNPQLLTILYNNKFDVNQKDERGETVLNFAIEFSNERFVKYLIDNGADVNKEGNKYCTPLVKAIFNGNINIVKYLIDFGADINKRVSYGNTPLIYAIENNNIDIIKCLVDNGANLNIEGENFDTPLIWAIKTNNEAVVQYLIACGVDVNKVEYKYCKELGPIIVEL
ncbi:ankyrin repeat-containing domain protein [Neocallimastix sp. 'constans']